ncbi:TetR family transcriptional regulator OS=Ureibacillus acetophenoni OX=614649 GN=SAMN05877842_112105 PE=4 SV=1 [Ureibacillus acetophenoni]
MRLPVQQITEHCGISKGAFYLSFKSKDELIIAIIDYFVKNVTSNIELSVDKQQTTQDKLASLLTL